MATQVATRDPLCYYYGFRRALRPSCSCVCENFRWVHLTCVAKIIVRCILAQIFPDQQVQCIIYFMCFSYVVALEKEPSKSFLYVTKKFFLRKRLKSLSFAHFKPESGIKFLLVFCYPFRLQMFLLLNSKTTHQTSIEIFIYFPFCHENKQRANRISPKNETFFYC